MNAQNKELQNVQRIQKLERELAKETAKVAALKQAAHAAKNVLTSASRSAGQGGFTVDEKYLDKLCEELNNVAELLK